MLSAKSDTTAAKAYSATLGDIYFNIRRTTLEDVFLELTGEDRGRFA